MARYLWDEKVHKLVELEGTPKDPNRGLNGPVWFPKGGHKYFDKALQREFSSLDEKKAYMREHKLIQQASDREGDTNCPEAGLGKRMYFIPGVARKSKYYKYR
jgi:hypothetical protein